MSLQKYNVQISEVAMYKFQGVIFDLDGVVCSTDRFHYTAWKQILDGVGIELDMQTNDKLRGLNREDYLARLLHFYYLYRSIFASDLRHHEKTP